MSRWRSISAWTPTVAVCCATLLLSWRPAHAFASSDDRGSAGFRGLLLAPNARVAALGGASVALPVVRAERTPNPAALAGIGRRSVSLSATSYVLDITPVGGMFVQPTRYGVWSITAFNLSYGDFRQIDEHAGEQGTFDANDIAVSAGWAGAWKYGISAGITLGWIRSRIADYSAAAAIADVGLLWTLNDGNTTIGLAATHLGRALSSYLGGDQGMKDGVPTAFRVGGMHRPAHFPIPLALLTEITLPRDDEASLSVGTELRPVAPLALRVGYSSLVRYAATAMPGETTGFSFDDRHTSGFGGLGLRFGLGLTWNDYGMDYAYGPAGPFGGVHHLSLHVLW